ncbi:MAG: hypothetical protein AAGE96_08105 [Cyanobacteria bacterium P01_G01_bin.19]
MEESRKDQIIANLQQAKQTGQLKTESIRDIVKKAVAEATSEVKEGRAEIVTLVQEAISAVVEIYKDKQGEIKEEISASIEVALDVATQNKDEKRD